MIKQDLTKYSDLFNEYTELRVQENRNIGIGILNGTINRNVRTSRSGVSARVYKDGYWGFASNPNISDETIKKVIDSASVNANFLSGKHDFKKGILPVTTTVSVNDFTTVKQRQAQKDMIDFLLKYDDIIKTKYPDLKSRSLNLGCLDMEKNLLTSTGSTSYSMIPRTIMYLSMTLEKDGKPIDLYEVYGGFGQFEDNFHDEDFILSVMAKQYENLRKKAEGVYAESGMKDVILDADLAGILAHEAIGHTTEGDIVLGGSVAADYMGQLVASPLITLTDFANEAFGEQCPVPVYVDDEGTKAEDAVIIEDGVLKSYMHNKETAMHFGHKPTGNARAYGFYDEPLVRMRNTAILPGKSKIEDMIASIDDGYYLIKSSNGQADSTSEFMFGVTLGYEIKKGKLGKAILDTTISGVAFDMLKTVTMVSDEVSWSCAGMCGKKQSIPVGMGGPAVKCKVNIGGR